MYDAWPFFRALLDNAEMSPLEADLEIAAQYDGLATAPSRGFIEAIAREHALAKRWITWIKGEVDLLDSRPQMQRSVLLRAPYLDPMHAMQVDLLRRWRASGRADRELFDALLTSVTGIALGLQATG